MPPPIAAAVAPGAERLAALRVRLDGATRTRVDRGVGFGRIVASGSAYFDRVKYRSWPERVS